MWLKTRKNGVTLSDYTVPLLRLSFRTVGRGGDFLDYRIARRAYIYKSRFKENKLSYQCYHAAALKGGYLHRPHCRTAVDAVEVPYDLHVVGV